MERLQSPAINYLENSDVNNNPPKTPSKAWSPVQVSLLSKVLNGEKPNEEEMAAARKMAERAVAQQKKAVPPTK